VGADAAPRAPALPDALRAGLLGDDRSAFRLAGLEQLFHPRQASRDVFAGDAARVERAPRQLRAGLADGLGRDDADRLAHLHQPARRQVAAVAADADAVPRAASQHRADDHRLYTGPLVFFGALLVDHL